MLITAQPLLPPPATMLDIAIAISSKLTVKQLKLAVLEYSLCKYQQDSHGLYSLIDS